MVLSSHYLPEKERTATNQFLLYHSKVNSTLFSLCYTGIMGCCLSILVCYFMIHEHLLKAHIYLHTVSGDVPVRERRRFFASSITFAMAGRFQNGVAVVS